MWRWEDQERLLSAVVHEAAVRLSWLDSIADDSVITELNLLGGRQPQLLSVNSNKHYYFFQNSDGKNKLTTAHERAKF